MNDIIEEENIENNLKNKYNIIIPPINNTINSETAKEILVSIFYLNFEKDLIDENIIGDYLCIKRLRVLVRILKLIDNPDNSLKKPILCTVLKNFLYSDEMIQRFKKIFEGKGIPFKKPNDNKIKIENLPIIEKDEEEKNLKKKINNNFNIEFNRLKLLPTSVNDISKAVMLLQHSNQLVWDLSNRISELERALSVLCIRLNEVEKLFSKI